jgi:SAM-dependent methyltransferase
MVHSRHVQYCHERLIPMSLDDFYDPLLYDLKAGVATRVDSFYAIEANTYLGPILELGCGMGNIMIPIAQAGISVVGIDSSNRMLEALAARYSAEEPAVQRNIEFMMADMRSFELNRLFRQVFIPNDGIAHLLDDEEMVSLFQRCWEHLLPGGRITLDTALFDVRYLAKLVQAEDMVLRDRGSCTLPDGELVFVSERTSYDQLSGALTAYFKYEYLDAAGSVRRINYRRLKLHPRRAVEIVFALRIARFADINIRTIDTGNENQSLLICATKNTWHPN